MNLTAAFVLFLLSGSSIADTHPSDNPDLARARQLVNQLADARFKVRNAAENEMLRLGLACVDALKEGENHLDPHVRDRCRALQPLIRAVAFKREVDQFLAQRNGPPPKGLPFVASFLKATGDSKEARELYAEVLQLHVEMLDDFDLMKVSDELRTRAPAHCSFTSDVKREAAHKKYREFREKQKTY